MLAACGVVSPSGMPYDLIMRNIVIDHVAAGVWKGRCSFPDCGIGVARAELASFQESRVKRIGGKQTEMSTPKKVEEAELDEQDDEAEKIVEEAVAFAEASPDPEDEALFEDIYTEPRPVEYRGYEMAHESEGE